MNSSLQIIESSVYGLRDTFAAVLADPTIKFEAEAGFAVQAIMASDYATKIALSNPQSVINAVTNVAAIGISLNPAKKQAYLVPRKSKICLDISYMGLMELAIASRSVCWAQSLLVYSNDKFRINGYDKPPAHDYEPFGADRGEIVGVYVVAKTADGDYLTHCMDLAAVFDIRERSEAWKAWLKDKTKCPWVTDAGEMIKKTCVKQASKYWPKTDRLDQAIHHLNVDSGEGLAVLAAPLPPVDIRAEWSGKVAQANTEDELRTISRAGAKVFQAAKDREGYTGFVQAVQSRGVAIKAKAATKPPIDDPFVIEMEKAEGGRQNA